MTNKIDKTRRFLVAGGAVLGVGALAAACGAQPMSNDAGTGGGGGADAGMDSDIELLNALLTAEYKAIDAYTQGAGVLMTDSSDLGKLVLAVAVEFQKDHKEHAVVLSATITALGGTPVLEANNKFTLPTGFRASTPNVMKLACNEERKAAIAYNQVIKGLKHADNRFISAAIQGDETQHYVVLVALIEGLAVPTAALTLAKADQVVPRAFVSESRMGAGNGLQAEADISVTDMM